MLRFSTQPLSSLESTRYAGNLTFLRCLGTERRVFLSSSNHSLTKEVTLNRIMAVPEDGPLLSQYSNVSDTHSSVNMASFKIKVCKGLNDLCNIKVSIGDRRIYDMMQYIWDPITKSRS